MWYTWRNPPCLYMFPGGMWWAVHTHQYLMENNSDEWDSKCRRGLFSAATNQRLKARTKTKRKHLFLTGRIKKPHVVACRSSFGGAVETYLHRAHHHTILCTLQGSSHRYTSPLSLDRSHWHTYPKTGTHRYLRKTHADLHDYHYKNIIKCGGIRFHNTGILMMSWLHGCANWFLLSGEQMGSTFTSLPVRRDPVASLTSGAAVGAFGVGAHPAKAEVFLSTLIHI